MKKGMLVAVALLGLGGLALMKRKPARSSGRSGGGSTTNLERRIDYAPGGEDFAMLRSGDRIVVAYDRLSPFRYVGQPTDVVELEPTVDGEVRFLVVKNLAAGDVTQVYVQALDEDDTVLGEHKITVQGP